MYSRHDKNRTNFAAATARNAFCHAALSSLMNESHETQKYSSVHNLTKKSKIGSISRGLLLWSPAESMRTLDSYHRYLLNNKLCAWPSPPRGRPSASRAASRRNVAVFLCPIRSHGHRCTALRPRWVKRPGDLDLLTLKVVSESRDVGYLCANFNLPVCSRLKPDVRDTSDRQTSNVRQEHRLMPPPIRGGGMTIKYTGYTNSVCRNVNLKRKF